MDVALRLRLSIIGCVISDTVHPSIDRTANECHSIACCLFRQYTTKMEAPWTLFRVPKEILQMTLEAYLRSIIIYVDPDKDQAHSTRLSESINSFGHGLAILLVRREIHNLSIVLVARFRISLCQIPIWRLHRSSAWKHPAWHVDGISARSREDVWDKFFACELLKNLDVAPRSLSKTKDDLSASLCCSRLRSCRNIRVFNSGSFVTDFVTHRSHAQAPHLLPSL